MGAEPICVGAEPIHVDDEPIHVDDEPVCRCYRHADTVLGMWVRWRGWAEKRRARLCLLPHLQVAVVKSQLCD